MDDLKIRKLFCGVMTLVVIVLILSLTSCGSTSYQKPVQLRMTPAQIEQDLTYRYAVVDSDIESAFIFVLEGTR